MLNEAMEALRVTAASKLIDATFGRGGHSREILRLAPPSAQLLALDRDESAITYAKQHFKDAINQNKLLLKHTRFSQLTSALPTGWNGSVDGVLMDLGVSSPQLDDASRGFSFQHDGPLDMRMDATQQLTAAAWLAKIPKRELARVIADWGQERYCWRIAEAIMQARARGPITTTLQLAEIVKKAHPHWERHKHPATRTFQAIRMAVNDEVNELYSGLEQAWRSLRIGGRLVVICFHSLEERAVKELVQHYSGHLGPRGLPVASGVSTASLRWTCKAQRASAFEVQQNVRARSAVMRVIERIG